MNGCVPGAPQEKAPVALAFVRIHIDPAFFETAVAHDAHVLFAHWQQPFCNPFHSLFKRNDLDWFSCQWGPHIVRFECFQAKRLAADFEVALPDREYSF